MLKRAAWRENLGSKLQILDSEISTEFFLGTYLSSPRGGEREGERLRSLMVFLLLICRYKVRVSDSSVSHACQSLQAAEKFLDGPDR